MSAIAVHEKTTNGCSSEGQLRYQMASLLQATRAWPTAQPAACTTMSNKTTIEASADGRASGLEAFNAKTKAWNVIVETPQGCRNKYKYDEATGLFMLSKVLPVGATFPFDFGYLPGTRAEDGDPLDVLLLMEEAAFCGCLVPSRLIGVIEAVQTEKNGDLLRNDRIVAIAKDARNYRSVRSIDDLDDHLLEEIQYFFKSYNKLCGKRFRVRCCKPAEHAEAAIEKAVKRFRKSHRGHKV